MSERFSRHNLIPGWNQSALAAATVIVVGVGALGNEVARLLAMAGVGQLLLCDPDVVEASNLSRTPLFGPDDVGRLKVDAARESLRRLSPSIDIVTRSKPHVHGIGLAEFRDASLTLSCLDSRSARLQLAGRCGFVRAGWIDGGTNPWGGEVRPFVNPEGPCYGCTLSASKRAEHDSPISCHAPNVTTMEGASAAISTVVASWMATHTLRHLMGLQIPETAQRIDAANASITHVQMQRAADCVFHAPVTDASRVDVTSQDPISKLREFCEDGSPVLWEPIIRSQDCPQCDNQVDVWRASAANECSTCGAKLRSITTIETNEVPDQVTLEQLGIPPHEIIGIRYTDVWRFLELTG